MVAVFLAFLLHWLSSCLIAIFYEGPRVPSPLLALTRQHNKITDFPKSQKEEGTQRYNVSRETGKVLRTAATEIKGYFTLKCSTGQNIWGLSQMKRLQNDSKTPWKKDAHTTAKSISDFWLLCPASIIMKTRISCKLHIATCHFPP